MCALCGLLGDGSTWSDALNKDDQGALRLDRFRRVKLLGDILKSSRVTVRNLANGSIMITGPSGKRVVLNSFAEFWDQLEKLGVPLPDPWDSSFWGNDAPST